MNKNFQMPYCKRMKYRDMLNDFITKCNVACSGFLVMFKGTIIFEYLTTILMLYNILP